VGLLVEGRDILPVLDGEGKEAHMLRPDVPFPSQLHNLLDALGTEDGFSTPAPWAETGLAGM
jgi:hypothetical protein